jgi:hypothetical protein
MPLALTCGRPTCRPKIKYIQSSFLQKYDCTRQGMREANKKEMTGECMEFGPECTGLNWTKQYQGGRVYFGATHYSNNILVV